MKHPFFSLCAGMLGFALALQTPSTAIAGSQETVLHSFSGAPDGANPAAGLVDVKGMLYGTTYYGGAATDGGTLFVVDPGTGAETVPHAFCSKFKGNTCENGGHPDGEHPNGSLINVKGRLYGTTAHGGAYNDGTVFAFDPKTAKEKVIYSFGTQGGYIDGQVPDGSLIDVNGTLYGTTQFGGTAGTGTVFALDPATGVETVLYSFCSQENCTDGAEPAAGLIDVDGTVYGVTSGGGAYRYGTVFALDPNTGVETVLYSFCSQQNCTDGEEPVAGLIDVGGTLYGTTIYGGVSYGGTVFSLDPNTGAETVLHSFDDSTRDRDGCYPEAGLVDRNGTLFGTTTRCGIHHDGGTVFALDPNTGAEKVLYSFCGKENCTDGANPSTSLIDVRSTLYGTTYDGGIDGTYGLGTVFAVSR